MGCGVFFVRVQRGFCLSSIVLSDFLPEMVDINQAVLFAA